MKKKTEKSRRSRGWDWKTRKTWGADVNKVAPCSEKWTMPASSVCPQSSFTHSSRSCEGSRQPRNMFSNHGLGA